MVARPLPQGLVAPQFWDVPGLALGGLLARVCGAGLHASLPGGPRLDPTR